MLVIPKAPFKSKSNALMEVSILMQHQQKAPPLPAPVPAPWETILIKSS